MRVILLVLVAMALHAGEALTPEQQRQHEAWLEAMRKSEEAGKARAAGFKLALLLVIGLVIVAGAVAAGLDYMGVVKLGLFPQPQPEQPTPVAEVPKVVVQPPAEPTRKPGIVVLGVAGEEKPIDSPAGEQGPPTVRGPVEPVAAPAVPARDPGEQKRLERRVESAQRGVDNVQGDLTKKQTAIEAHLRGLYGIIPDPRDTPPDRIRWRHPCAMLELEEAQRAPKTNEAQWHTRLQNAQAAVNNFNKYLAEDRKMEKALLGRMEKARRELDGAKEALAQ